MIYRIVTEMWREGKKIVFRASVKETGKPCISNAAAELRSLEETWRKGIERMVETQVAGEAIKQEILQRKRRGAS